jgi:Tol biopolymer transport system component
MRRSLDRAAGATIALAAAALSVSCLLAPVAFSPDGKRLAAVVGGEKGPGDRPAELWVTELETGKSRMVGKQDAFGTPAWSEDGKTLWFLQGTGHAEFRVMAWDGSESKELGTVRFEGDYQLFTLCPPQVLPGGRSLLLADTRDGASALVRFDLAKREASVLRPRAGAPALSPGGDRVAFLSIGEEQKVDLAVMPLEGGEAKVVARGLGDLKDLSAFTPVWSPDGKRLLYNREAASAGEDIPELWSVGADGEGNARFGGEAEAAIGPVFAIDGKTVYYGTQRAEEPWRVRRRDPEGKITDLPGGEGSLVAGRSPDGKWLALRVALVKPESDALSDREGSFVRLLDPASGETKDIIVNAWQLLSLARTRMLEGDAAAATAALDRLAKEFPDAAEGPIAARLRAQLKK